MLWRWRSYKRAQQTFTNQCSSSTQSCSVPILTLVYPVLAEFCVILHGTRGIGRSKNQMGLGNSRTTPPLCKIHEKWAGRTNWEPLWPQVLPVPWALLSLSPEGGTVTKNGTQASPAYYTCWQRSLGIQTSSLVLCGHNDFKEAGSVGDVPWYICPYREDGC